MQKYLLSFCLILLFTISSVTLAADYQVTGGYLYTTLDLSEMNENEINTVNDMIVQLKNLPNISVTDYQKIPAIKNGSGFYIGLRKPFFGYDSTIKYESFNQETEGYFTLKDNNIIGKQHFNYDLKIYGVTYKVYRNLNKYFNLTCDLGYYTGHGTREITARYIPDLQNENHDTIDKFILTKRLGLKLGTNFKYKLTDKLFFLSNISYRYLRLKVNKDTRSTIKDGKIINVVENPQDNFYIDKLNLDGFQVSTGLFYTF